MTSSALSLPRPSLPLIVATQALLVLLLLVGIGVELLLPGLAAGAAASLPEYAELRSPLLGIAIGFCVLIQLAIIAALVLVQRIYSGRILVRASLLWVDIIVLALGLAVVPVLIGFVVISEGQAGSPFLLLVQVTTILTLTAIACITLVLRSLLRHAIVLRAELDEVV
jgi:hypothetical protein